MPDTTLRDMVISKFVHCSGVSFADVAATADTVGRKDLAKLLLEYEPRVADQVPLLLKMRAEEVALDKALQSGDSDFVFLCLFHSRKMCGEGLPLCVMWFHECCCLGGQSCLSRLACALHPSSVGMCFCVCGCSLAVDGDEEEKPFLRLLVKFPRAASMFIKYCKANDRVMLKRIYRAFGRCMSLSLSVCVFVRVYVVAGCLRRKQRSLPASPPWAILCVVHSTSIPHDVTCMCPYVCVCLLRHVQAPGCGPVGGGGGLQVP